MTNEDESAAEKKVIMLERKFESNTNGVIEGIANLGLLSLPLRLPRVPSGGELINTKEESGCKGKDEDVPEEVMNVKLHIKGISEILHNVEGTEATMLEADPDLVRKRTVHRGVVAKILPLHHELYDKKKASAVQTLLIHILQRSKTL